MSAVIISGFRICFHCRTVAKTINSFFCRKCGAKIRPGKNSNRT